MRLVKLTMLRKWERSAPLALTIPSIFLFIGASAQDNSPYSRYGLGNQAPTTNISNRGMGGVAAAYNDPYTVNYANPASFSFFSAQQEPGSRKLNSGRVVFNIGADGQGRTLTDQSAQNKFTSPNLLFSHVMMGLPLRKNWGMAFGVRPITSINYKIQNSGKLYDPNTGNLIVDSSTTLYEGQGGAYLGSLGTAVKFKTGKSQYLSLGVNAGYMFGSRDYNTRVSLYDDSTAYAAAHYESKTSLGDFYFDAGLQYHFKASDKIYVGLGAYGNWQQEIKTNRNTVAETYTYSTQTGYIPIDTATSTSNIKSSLIYPSSVTGGFVISKLAENEAGWTVGADFTRNNWDQFRFEGARDTAVRSNWQAKIGAEFHPVPKNNYFSRTAYRIGFFTGPDYIYTRQTKIPVLGISAGLGLPIANYSLQSRFQASMINLSFEYIKRGNNTNIIQENLYRLSVGFSLTDLWFGGKTKYYED
ncbi:hypothetical protein ABDK00_000600 [Niabella insulamsoli]|uniref:hypothetical protein n=1 Tax=Niabella insulamsoli TaxID=3144874 RepID=UPI0031FE2488